MSNKNLKQLRENKTPQENAEMVALVKKSYPGFDKPLLSKCSNSERYGVELVPEAMKILLKRFDQEQTPEKPQKQRAGERHSFPAGSAQDCLMLIIRRCNGN